MRGRRFKGLAAFGIVNALGLTVTGCGTETAGGGDVTLKLVAEEHGQPGEASSTQKYWDEVIERFEAETEGISVEVTVVSESEAADKVSGMVEAGEAPDLAQVSSYAEYANNGELYTAAELLSIPTHANLVPSVAKAGALAHTQYALPFASTTRMFVYNKRLFGEAGLDPQRPPETWEEIRQAAEALKDAGVKHPYGLPLGPEEAEGEAMMWLLSGGGGITDSLGGYTLDLTENVDTLTWLRDELVGEGLTGPGAPGDTNRESVFEAFGAGDVGMLNGHPALLKAAKKGKIDYGTAPLPGDEAPAGVTVGEVDWMLGFKHNDRRKEVGAFLDFVYKDEQHYEFTDRYDMVPVTTSGSEKLESDRKRKDLLPFLEQLGKAEFYPLNKTTWTDVTMDVRKGIGSAVEKKAEPESVLRAIQRKAEARELAANEDE